MELTSAQMTPIIGQGANMALEEAAALTNLLTRLVHQDEVMPTSQQVESLLNRFRQMRVDRAKSTFDTSTSLNRLGTQQGFFWTLISRRVLPYAGDMPAYLGSLFAARGEFCRFLPIPRRSGPGWEMYKSKQRWRPVQMVIVILVAVLSYYWLHLQ
ncbi:hypothetical protein BO78DRAFT_412850 [Aspergillus sclerotiicarbonarius CBS 121057]|uniref:FAD-binding domain-containing protein n=1 Tax=Aspergillus sclerotiicarbonarius (strain CBS 121057 / IBT 28362) TaxID=1448318 RepID=A0A319ESD9_ASPSB|nr:hypothetical protein BO78DRAFT_412850 [Aspergillus sclerotiicarbonarius CBS 121057]